MENQAYYIQTLLTDKLDRYKGKENTYANKHIKEIQDAYKQEDLRVKQSMIVNKGEQWKDQIQNEEVLLYKPYNILSKSSKAKTPEPTFIQDKIENLDKYIKYMQSSIKMMPFYLSLHYKFIWPQIKQNK